MKRESLHRAKEIYSKLIDLEALLEEFNKIDEELNKIKNDDFYLKFYLTFHTNNPNHLNMVEFSKDNPYIFESIDFERKGIEFQIYELTKELETL